MTKTCTTCGNRYQTRDYYARQCKACIEEAEAKAAEAYVPMAQRTCVHCLALLGKRLHQYRLNSGAVERWCPLCVKWFGRKYEARLVKEDSE